MQETQVQSLSQEDPLQKEIATTPAFLPGKYHGQRSLEGYSPWGHKRVTLSNNTIQSNKGCLNQRQTVDQNKPLLLL